MTRTIAIGLVAGAAGVVDVILLDHLTHVTTHTVLSAVFLVLLLAAALLLRHVALTMEQAMGLTAPPSGHRSSPDDFNPRSH